MTKDYKKEANTKSPASGGYGWMLSGIVLGLLVGLGMYFYGNYRNASTLAEDSDATEVKSVALGENGDPSIADAIQEPDPISEVIKSARQEQQDRKRASFSYYAVLPNLELDINVQPSERDKPAQPEAIEKIVLKPGTHILQIASFKSEKQARKTQENLLQKGLETRIEKRRVQGKDWFRVFAGPTEQSAAIDRWRNIVITAGFKPLIIDVK